MGRGEPSYEGATLEIYTRVTEKGVRVPTGQRQT